MSSKTKKSGNKTKSDKAGLILPVTRIYKILKHGNFAPRVGSGAAVSLTAVLEYLASEILDLASEVAAENNKSRLVPRHLVFAIKQDEELSRMLNGVTISQGGILPGINAVLLPKKTMKKSQQETSGSQEF